MKYCYKSELIRPKRIYAALFWLKANHPSYKDVEIKDYDSWMNELLFDYDGDDTENDVLDSDIEYCDIQNKLR